jgi:hypothetical protein
MQIHTAEVEHLIGEWIGMLGDKQRQVIESATA